MQVRGRHLVVAWTAVCLTVVAAIVLRTKAGFEMRARVDSIESHMKALDGIRGDLEAKVAGMKSRSELAPKAKLLGLRFTSDTEMRILPVPSNR